METKYMFRQSGHLSVTIYFFLLTTTIYFMSGYMSVLWAQDLKPISSTLAIRISASGHKTIAVIDFVNLEGNVTEFGRFLAEDFSVNLFEQARGFDVIDRTHLKVLIQEHRLSTTGLIDPQTARKLGQIAGADALVTGTITPLGDSIRLSIKVIDTETAKLIGAATTDIPKTPAIVALMNQSGSEGQVSNLVAKSSSGPGSSTPKSNNEVSVEQNDILFVVRKCIRSGNKLTCFGYVNNKSEKRLVVDLSGKDRPSIVDEFGNQYSSQHGNLSFGSREPFFNANSTKQDLEPDLPIAFSFSVDDVTPTVTRATVILWGWFQSKDGLLHEFKVALKNVAIEQK